MRTSDLTKLRHSKELFVENCKNNNMSLVSDFINSNRPVMIKCNKCNKIKTVKPSHFKHRNIICLGCYDRRMKNEK